MMFEDRYDAAHQLAKALEEYKDNNDVVIMAIPRGGLEVGYVLSQELHAPLDVAFSKKIGAPFQPEFAIGAVTLEDRIIDPDYDRPDLKVYIEQETKQIRELLQKRTKQYRGDKEPIDLKNKIVIITDDGIATGKTMLLTVDLIRNQKPKKIVVAIPVAPPETISLLQKKADEVVCLSTPIPFGAVGAFYRSFSQVEDEEAIRLLREANQ